MAQGVKDAFGTPNFISAKAICSRLHGHQLAGAHHGVPADEVPALFHQEGMKAEGKRGSAVHGFTE